MKKLNSLKIPILKYTTSTVEFWIIISILLFLVIVMTKTLLFAPSADMVAFMECAAHFGTLLGGIGTLGLVWVAWKAKDTWKQEISFGHILGAKKNLLSTVANINELAQATVEKSKEVELQGLHASNIKIQKNLLSIIKLENELAGTFTTFETLSQTKQGDTDLLNEAYKNVVRSSKELTNYHRGDGRIDDGANFMILRNSKTLTKNTTAFLNLIKTAK